jgi:hypothetical protein
MAIYPEKELKKMKLQASPWSRDLSDYNPNTLTNNEATWIACQHVFRKITASDVM